MEGAWMDALNVLFAEAFCEKGGSVRSAHGRERGL
tara:strand:- start:7983 stop:8087 length:105 start_codon:yes stop_codon:yes gene_type:complete